MFCHMGRLVIGTFVLAITKAGAIGQFAQVTKTRKIQASSNRPFTLVAFLMQYEPSLDTCNTNIQAR